MCYYVYRKRRWKLMSPIIEINNIDLLPQEKLSILRDNLGKTDTFSLCLKTNDMLSNNLKFKLNFIVIDSIPIFILMLKCNKKIYTSLISLEITKEYTYLKNLMKLPSFNLFIFSDKKMITIKKIKNTMNKKILKLMNTIENMDIHASLTDIDNAKNKLLEMYNDKELWKLKY